MQGLVIREVAGRGDLSEFLELPWQIYCDDPHWVPPLIADQRAMLDPGGPFFEHAEGLLLLAERDGKALGRIAALKDELAVEKNVGCVGFFESIEDEAVARALFDRAEQWLGQRGVQRVRGPISLSALNGPWGLLVEGEPGEPCVMMSHNRPYYPGLFEVCGYRKGKDTYALWGAVREMPDADDRLQTVESQGIRLRTWSKRKAAVHMEALIELRNKAWEKATPYAFAKGSQPEGRHLVASMKSIVDPDIMIWAEREGRPIGMGICLPDISPVLKALDGRYGPIRILKAMIAGRRLDGLRFAEYVVDPAEHRRGLGTAMAVLAMQNAHRKGYKRAEFSWIYEDNTPSLKMAEYLGGKIARRYRIYEKDLSGDLSRDESR